MLLYQQFFIFSYMKSHQSSNVTKRRLWFCTLSISIILFQKQKIFVVEKSYDIILNKHDVFGIKKTESYQNPTSNKIQWDEKGAKKLSESYAILLVAKTYYNLHCWWNGKKWQI